MRNLMILSKWLTAQADVDVMAYDGDTACIALMPNGRKVIRLPRHWCAVKDDESVALLEGVIDHEALGHGRFTNFHDDEIAKDRGYDINGFTRSVSNILEDVMIETKAIATYPGVKFNLSRTVKILKEKKNFFGSIEAFQTAQPSFLLVAGLLNCLRSACIPGQDEILGDHAEILHELLDGHFGDLWKTVFAIGMEVKNSNQTIDNWVLTQRIVDVLKDASNSKIQGQSDDSQGDQDDGDDSKGQGQSDDSQGDQDDGDDSKGQGQSDDSQGDQDDGDDSKGQGQSDDSQDDQDDDDDSKGQGQSDDSKGKGKKASGNDSAPGTGMNAAVIAAVMAVLNSVDKEIPTDISTGASQVISADAGKFKPSFAPVVQSMPEIELHVEQRRISSQVNAVADDLKDALIAQAYSGKFNKLAGKRLNSRVVSRVKTGNPRIFQSKTQCDGVAAAVSILVDTSGSMITSMSDRKPRFFGSIGVSVGLADVLSEFDVPFEVSFYDQGFFTKKTFNEDWNDVRKSNSYPVPNGGTTTGAAVQAALSELILRDESRRLLIVITDGDTTDVDLLASCYEEAEIAGIEIASLMVGNPIPAIQMLAASVGFSVETHNSCEGIARYVVKHVLATI